MYKNWIMLVENVNKSMILVENVQENDYSCREWTNKRTILVQNVQKRTMLVKNTQNDDASQECTKVRC